MRNFKWGQQAVVWIWLAWALAGATFIGGLTLGWSFRANNNESALIACAILGLAVFMAAITGFLIKYTEWRAKELASTTRDKGKGEKSGHEDPTADDGDGL